MRFAEIGQQLRAFRMESGLRAEEIAARLGVSRAALYRYEKGEVIKLDTVKRLAELLNVSPLSLLGIGVEYYTRPTGYLERLRQVEETADQILQAAGPICFLTTSDRFDAAVADAMFEAVRLAGADRASAQLTAEQITALNAARKRSYQQRKPGIISIISTPLARAFLDEGVMPGADLPDSIRAQGRQVAAQELERIADLMETEPMGLQFGLLTNPEHTSEFVILRNRDRATLAVNPFRSDTVPLRATGVAMVTGADEAVASHQRVAESLWRDSLRGRAAATALRELIASRH